MAVDPRALLMAQLAGGGGGPAAPPDMGGAPPDLGPAPGPPPPTVSPTDNPLDALQAVIQDLHALIGVLPDPNHTKVASQCLTALTGIQKDLMAPTGPGGGGPGGGGGPPPPGY